MSYEYVIYMYMHIYEDWKKDKCKCVYEHVTWPYDMSIYVSTWDCHMFECMKRDMINVWKMTNVYVKISMWYEYVFVYKHMQRIMIYGSMMLACYVICICVYMYEIVWGMI